MNLERKRLLALPKSIKATQLVAEKDVLLEFYKNFPAADFRMPGYSYHWLLLQDQQGPESFLIDCDGEERDLSQKLNANAVIFIPAFRKTEWQFSQGQGCMHILFSDRVIFEVMAHWSIPAFLIDDIYDHLGENLDDVAKPLGKILHEIKNYGCCSAVLFEEALYAAVTIILLNQFGLYRDGKQGHLKVRKKSNSGLLSEQQLQLLREYVWSNYANKIYLKDLADLFNMTPYHFCRLFSKTMGVTPMQYIQKLRIDVLRNKISHKVFYKKTINLSRLALQVGFYDQSHMTKVFFRCVGITPMKYIQSIS